MALSQAVHSNAFNFENFIQSQVDPRTGQYTCTVTLPELTANTLCGPVIPLQLNFNPLNNADSGFGIGWNLQLSQYNPDSRIVALHTGETLKVNPVEGGVVIPEQKIDSFHFTPFELDGIKKYRIAHKSGLVEILEKRQGNHALPVEMYSPLGHRVQLEYVAFGVEPLLSRIRDDDRVLLSLERTTNQLTLIIYPDSALEATFVFEIRGGRTQRINLPTDDAAAWQFDYETQHGLTLLKSVHTPTGSHETVTYSGNPHHFPGLDSQRLPRVASHIVNPGFEQPAIESRYEYGSDEHNFLGYGSGVVWSDDGLDNLYKTVNDYRYETRELLWDASRQQALRTTRRQYNRFHLMVLEEITQRDLETSLPDTLLVTEIEYHIIARLPFNEQPPYCQLPKTVTRTWRNANSTHPNYAEVVRTTYDDFGNLLTTLNADGTLETSEWYSVNGEEGNCPADPEGFVRYLKTLTVTPAASPLGNAPVLQTRYRYITLPGLNNAVDTLLMSDETLCQVIPDRAPIPLKHTRHEYIDSPEEQHLHGRLSRLIHILHDDVQTQNITEYSYSTQNTLYASTPVLRTVSTVIGFDDSPQQPVRNVITQEHSLLDGNLIRTNDDSSGEVLYRYDRLRRVISETVAPGTAYQAKRLYSYALTNGGAGQQAMQSVTDVKGVTTQTWMDGLNRVVRAEREDKDHPLQAMRPIYRARYNAFSQMSEETSIDWEGSKDVPLSSTFHYDTWGAQYKVIGADAVAHVTQTDPVNHTLRTWTESAGPTVVKSEMTHSVLNRFGKPDTLQALDAKGVVRSTRAFRYDGLGNCIEQDDALGRTTRFTYDAFSRLQSTTLPNEDRIQRNYARHSMAELPTQLQIYSNGETPEGTRSRQTAEVNAVTVGQQTFDGLERRTSVRTGPRLQQFRYQGGQTQASSMITASQKEISYEYTLGLTDSPVGSIAPDEQSSFNYDPSSAQLTTAKNTQGEHRFDYDSTGQLRDEQWQDNSSGKTWKTTYSQTLQGRPLRRVDSSGMPCSYTYDDQARLKTMTQGQVIAVFEYDAFSRLNIISTRDMSSGAIVQTTLGFDDQGREVSREVTSAQVTQTITQTYYANDKLQTRLLQRNGVQALHERFSYDRRGRLITHRFEGPDLPKDRYGNAIIEQVFGYDALDNVTMLSQTFADKSYDQAFSTFAENDPCQLLEVEHSHPHYPAKCVLEYDADGNLTRDENGQTLQYDSQGRLLRVTDSDGLTASQYRYDAHNHLLGVKHGGQGETLRFYEDEQLVRTEQGALSTHLLYVGEQPLAQQHLDHPEQTLLLLTDAHHSVLAESGQNSLRQAIYSAYGERTADDGMQCLLGFNGEVRDPVSGWYLLGRGYRAYNPTLMRFHSPDSLSPFGAGGVNPYVYCAGDPINAADPTGHFERKRNKKGMWGAIMAAIGIVLTVAAIIIAPPVGIASIAFTAAMTTVGVTFGFKTIQAGILATTAETLKERKQAEQEAFIGGAMDLAFGLLDIGLAARAAHQAAKAAAKNKAAKTNWHSLFKANVGHADELAASQAKGASKTGNRGKDALEIGSYANQLEMPRYADGRPIPPPKPRKTQKIAPVDPASQANTVRAPKMSLLRNRTVLNKWIRQKQGRGWDLHGTGNGYAFYLLRSVTTL